MVFRKKSNGPAAPAPVIAPVNADGEPDMRGLGRLLWQKKAKILAFTLICAAAAFVVVNAMTPRYRSESRVLLEARQNVFLRADADKNVDRTPIDPETVASQVQVLLSRDLAREVIKEENLASKPEFDPAVAGRSPMRTLLSLFGIERNINTMTKEERTLEAYYDRLNVQAVDKSRVIVIDFTSANPQLASDVANAIAQTYLRMQQVDQQSQTRAAGDWLAGEIEKMRKKVADAEEKVEQYRANSNLFVVGNNNNTLLPTQQLSDLNTQIAAARAQEADLEARASQLRAQLRSGRSIDSSDLANSDTMRRLVQQRIALESQLAQQSTTLLPRHPRIQELKAQIAETNRQIKDEGERLARQLDSDAKVAGDRIKTLTATLNDVKKMASQANAHDVTLRALEREAKTERDLLESYLQKYREASARDSISAAPPEARIISRASPSLDPAYPKKLPTVLIVAFAAFALSTGFTVTGALLAPPAAAAPYPYPYAAGYAGVPQAPGAGMAAAPRMVASPPLAPASAPPVYAEPPAAYGGGAQVIPIPPDLRPGAESPHAPSPQAPQFAGDTQFAPDAPLAPSAPIHASSIEEIAGAAKIAARLGSEDAGRIAVVGAARNVGTTYAAITLARALAEDGSVVLVDLAFGAPNLSVISSDPEAPGIADLVHGSAASFGDIITRDQYSNVHLVATGDPAGDV
ncbi:MAG TPA: exopolysaccharide transport family protein, partial [Pseudolabrys sp.]|nr:exopolysaccharide transport family protein [Pseudolabrys sp.]